MMAEKLGHELQADLRAGSAPVTVMTRAARRGALITVGNEEFSIPPARPAKVVDPTGAGDAFRAGFVLGLTRKLPWPTRLAGGGAGWRLRHRTAWHATTFLHAS